MKSFVPYRPAGATLRRLPRSLPRRGLKSRVSVRRTLSRPVASRPLGRAGTASRVGFVGRRKNPMIRKIVKGQVGGRPSFSKWSTSKAPSPRVSAMKMVGSPNYYVTNESAQMLVSDGFQNAQSFSFQGLVDIKAIRNLITSATPPAPYRQFVLQSSTCEYLITNSTLATMYVDIYDVVRKRTQTGTAFNQTSLPEKAWASGVYDESVGDLTAWQVPNSLPTDSRLFKDYFKVVQRNHIALGQGDTHRHHLKLKSNELLDDALISSADGDIAGVSVYTMIVAYGQPASIKSGEDPAVVTTASGALDIIATKRYKYTWCQDLTTNFSAQDNLSTLAGEQIVSRGAGVIVPNAKV